MGKGIVLYLCVPAGVNCPTPSPKGVFLAPHSPSSISTAAILGQTLRPLLIGHPTASQVCLLDILCQLSSCTSRNAGLPSNPLLLPIPRINSKLLGTMTWLQLPLQAHQTSYSHDPNLLAILSLAVLSPASRPSYVFTLPGQFLFVG